MRHYWGIVIAVILLFSLCACGGGGDDVGEKNSPDAQETPTQSGTDPTGQAQGDNKTVDIDAMGGIDVDRNLFEVTITVPKDFVGEGATQEQLNETAKEKGIKSITLNEDGSATYVMTNSKHKELMDEIKETIEAKMSDMVAPEKNQSYVKIEANDDYTQYKVTVNVEEIGLGETIPALGLYLSSGMYHAFNGTEIENINIQFISESTGEVLDEMNYSDIK